MEVTEVPQRSDGGRAEGRQRGADEVTPRPDGGSYRGQTDVRQSSHKGHTEVTLRTTPRSEVGQRSDRSQTEVRQRSDRGQAGQAEVRHHFGHTKIR
jgi:hypothetical protein